MKIQDFIFLLAIAVVLVKRNYKLSALFGLISVIIAIPLFAKWIFFTAERLVWYAAGFFLLSMLLLLFKIKKKYV